jgi:hypothetical protein
MKRFTRDQMAARVGRDIPNGAYVNLGIGLPTMVANHLPKDREIILHTENGPRHGSAPEAGARRRPHQCRQVARDDAARRVVLHHADSFAMMRGGHLDSVARRVPGIGDGRSRQLAHRRAGRDWRSVARWILPSARSASTADGSTSPKRASRRSSRAAVIR